MLSLHRQAANEIGLLRELLGKLGGVGQMDLVIAL